MAGMIEGRGKCTKRFVQSAKKIAKFLLSLVELAQFIVKSVFQNEKTAAVKTGAIKRVWCQFLMCLSDNCCEIQRDFKG